MLGLLPLFALKYLSSLFCIVLTENCTALSQSESSNFFMYIINTVIYKRLMNFAIILVGMLRLIFRYSLKLTISIRSSFSFGDRYLFFPFNQLIN